MRLFKNFVCTRALILSLQHKTRSTSRLFSNYVHVHFLNASFLLPSHFNLFLRTRQAFFLSLSVLHLTLIRPVFYSKRTAWDYSLWVPGGLSKSLKNLLFSILKIRVYVELFPGRWFQTGLVLTTTTNIPKKI